MTQKQQNIIKEHIKHMNSCRICREENTSIEDVYIDEDDNFAERT